MVEISGPVLETFSGSFSLMTTTHYTDLSVSVPLSLSLSVSVWLSVCLSVCLICFCSISRTGCKTGPNGRNATYNPWCRLVVSAGLQSHGARLEQRLPQPQRRPLPSHLTAICTTNTALTRMRSHAQGRQLHKLPHKLPC